MSKPGNNDFDDLINNRQPADDFEKEALEGFDLLSPEEARQTKAELDREIYPTVFGDKKTRRPIAFWYAAAGLLLLVGLSTYFFLASNKRVTNEMAQQLTNTQTQSSPAPAQESLPSAISSKDPEAAVAAERKEDNNTGQKNATPASVKTVKAEKAKAMAINEPEANPDTEEKDIKQQESASGDYAAQPANAGIAKSETDEVVKYLPPVYEDAQPKKATSGGYDKEALAKREKKQTEREIPAKSKTPVEDLKPSAVSSSAANDAPGIACFYSGGNESFNKELAALLDKKVAKKIFSGTLVISFNRKVLRVIPDEKQLTQKEQKLAVEALSKLNNFILPLSADSGAVFHYRYAYTP